MIQITVEGRRASVSNKEILTSGSVGIECQWTFSEDWAGLTKTAVFRFGEDGDGKEIVLTSTNRCVVPWEVLTEKEEPVFAGVYGINDETGTIVVPTVWASIGVVKPGVEVGTPAIPAPTPSEIDQVKTIANDALNTAQQAMNYAEGEVDSARQYAESANLSMQGAASYYRMANDKAYQADRAAGNANGFALTAGNYAQTASQSASEASQSATNAASSASTATAKAGEANTSATTASQAAQSASSSATAAENSYNSARNEASQAATSATTARGMALTAGNYMQAAAQSAAQAAGSATNASRAQTAAETAQGAAETAQGKAEDAQAAAEDAQAAAEASAQSVSASAAQIAQNASDISDLNRQISDFVSTVSDVQYIRNTFDDSPFSITKEQGKYTNYSGEYVSNTSFDSYQFQVTNQSGIYFDGSFAYLSMCVYSALPISEGTCVSGRITGDSLPSSETPYVVNSGYHVVISINHSSDSLVFYSNYNGCQIKNSALGGVLSTGYKINTIDSTDFAVTVLDGKYANYDGGLVDNSGYTSYQIIGTKSCDVYFDTTGIGYTSLCVYSGTPSASTCVSGRLRDDTLPNASRPYHIESGYYAIISVDATGNLAFYSNYNNTTFVSDLELSQGQIDQIGKLYSPNSDLYVANKVVPSDNASILQIFADMSPTVKLRIDLYKYIIPADAQIAGANSNVWVMGGVYTTNNSFKTLEQVINALEWDCAIRETDASDFMGGKQHGDEIFTEWHIFADGKEIDPTIPLVPFRCSSIDLVQTSKLNRVGQPTDYLIEHTKHTKITRKNVFIEQTFKALQTFSIDQSFVAMLSLTKDYADKFIRKGTSIMEDITSDSYVATSTSGNNAWADIISDKSIIRFEVDSDSDMNPAFYINKGSNDNKCYYTMNGSTASWQAGKVYSTHFNVLFEINPN